MRRASGNRRAVRRWLGSRIPTATSCRSPSRRETSYRSDFLPRPNYISATMEDLTTGPLTRHLLKTTSFMLVTMIFQTLYFLIDLYWVGRLGTHAVAAVAI